MSQYLPTLPVFLMAEAGMSLLSLLLFLLDKWHAIRHKKRIRERVLHASMWLLGAPGGLVAMLLFRHKTAHPAFWLSGIGALLFQLALAWACYLERL